jgi:electron transport complex protein RnfD
VNQPLTVSVSPHRRDTDTVPLIMWTVALALVPAFAVGMYVFGWRTAYVTALSVIFCVATEAIIQYLRGMRVTVSDGSAALTGVLLAFVLPPTVAWYVPFTGAIIAVGVGKQAFGGLGANFFNPALLARAFLQFAFPTQVSMAKWPIIAGVTGYQRFACDVATSSADAVTRATPMALLKGNPGIPWSSIVEGSPFGPPMAWLLPGVAAGVVFGLLVVGALVGIYASARSGGRLGAVVGIGALLLFGVIPTGDLSFGMIPGCIGETSAWAVVLGGLALVYYRLINWRLPAAYIMTLGVLAALLPVKTAGGTWVALQSGRVMAHVLGGGLFLGAFFMITDMVTSPLTSKGQIAYGVLAGVLVALIRIYGGYPEGVCYSILLANAARPLIDKYTTPVVFGKKPQKVEAAT